MSNLRLPFAVDDQERVHSPTNAEKGKAYFCPACRDSVILRKGEINTAHFAHKTTDACNDDTDRKKRANFDREDGATRPVSGSHYGTARTPDGLSARSFFARSNFEVEDVA